MCQTGSWYLIACFGSLAGGTISDDEDMAWGEQAQLAVEANAPHKKFDSSDKDPGINRRSVNRNFMRCYPERRYALLLHLITAAY